MQKDNPYTRIVISVINDLSGDQRIHRIASTLKTAGYEVLVVGRLLPKSRPLSKRSYDCYRMSLFFHKGKLFYLEFNIRLFFFLYRQKFDILNANDLDTLLANYGIARLKRVPLVYDSHEYFTEVPELVNRKLTRSVWVRLERLLFPRLKHVYTVNQSLAHIYQAQYQVPVKVIRNVPLPIIPKDPPEKVDPPILLYQGALNVGRGIELMIQAMRHLEAFQLWIIGRGDIEEKLRALTKAEKLSNRVSFKGFIPFERLNAFTCMASLGFSLEEDLGANYHYASPNKVYDYIQNGVPVLVSDLPEMRYLVEKYHVGEVLPRHMRTPEALADHVKRIFSQQHNLLYHRNTLEAGQSLNWEAEKHQLLAIYKEAHS